MLGTSCEDATSGNPATMATQDGNCLIVGTLEKPPVERDMVVAEAGEASSAAIQRERKTTPVAFTTASEQLECYQNEK